jgi:hypothetical protein
MFLIIKLLVWLLNGSMESWPKNIASILCHSNSKVLLWWNLTIFDPEKMFYYYFLSCSLTRKIKLVVTYAPPKHIVGHDLRQENIFLKIWNWSFVNREGKYDLEKIIIIFSYILFQLWFEYLFTDSESLIHFA